MYAMVWPCMTTREVITSESTEHPHFAGVVKRKAPGENVRQYVRYSVSTMQSGSRLYEFRELLFAAIPGGLLRPLQNTVIPVSGR